jgi:pimeloyl-ACP methyl ester carboxylesterase
MPSVNLNGELFHYACVGKGLPFVFQHGMGADVTQPLSSCGNLAGWRIFAMDCRGHGQTEANLDPARISFAQFAEDLAVLLDSLIIERAVVGGISMGAGVALAFALAHPERVNGLILVRPAWLDRPFPANLRWFPLAASLLQEYPADEAARRCEQSSAFSPSWRRNRSRPPSRCWDSFADRTPASGPQSLPGCRRVPLRQA